MQHWDIASRKELTVPDARVANLVTTASRNEVLVYDQDRHHIHHLNATAAAVWNLCNGKRTVAQVARAAGVDEDAVRLALRKLADANLLDGPLEAEIRGTTHSRRSFMKKAAVAGAIAVPAIVSISAPTAAQSGSPGGEPTQPAQTCSQPDCGAGRKDLPCCVGNTELTCRHLGGRSYQCS